MVLKTYAFTVLLFDLWTLNERKIKQDDDIYFKRNSRDAFLDLSTVDNQGDFKDPWSCL